jgi:hypothetical protein
VTDYVVTFGQKYARETHPLLPEAHPDNWVVIEAPGLGEAREAAYGALADLWCDAYSPQTWAEISGLFPGREVARYRYVPGTSSDD